MILRLELDPTPLCVVIRVLWVISRSVGALPLAFAVLRVKSDLSAWPLWIFFIGITQFLWKLTTLKCTRTGNSQCCTFLCVSLLALEKFNMSEHVVVILWRRLYRNFIVLQRLYLVCEFDISMV